MEVKHNVPFYSQHWDLGKWKKYGFKNCASTEYWQSSSCGVLCLKMAVEALTYTSPVSISEYVKIGQEIGAYTDKYGWSHNGLSHLAERFGVTAVAKEGLASEELKNCLDKNSLPIISIKWAFEDKKTLKEKILFWKKYGGHMALVVGYNKQGFIVHHTSIIQKYNWQYKLISADTFKRAFTGRGLIVSRK